MPAPFGTEQALNAEVTVCLVHIATLTQRTSLYIPANIKHSNLQLPRDSGGTYSG